MALAHREQTRVAVPRVNSERLRGGHQGGIGDIYSFLTAIWPNTRKSKPVSRYSRLMVVGS
jgi:hypothetical protein